MWVNSQGWLTRYVMWSGNNKYFVDFLSAKDSCEKKKNGTNWEESGHGFIHSLNNLFTYSIFAEHYKYKLNGQNL